MHSPWETIHRFQYQGNQFYSVSNNIMPKSLNVCRSLRKNQQKWDRLPKRGCTIFFVVKLQTKLGKIDFYDPDFPADILV